MLYRSPDLRKYQYFMYPDWTGGLYCTPTVAGSRSGAVSAACWASMIHMGRRGYLNATRRIIAAARQLRAGIDGVRGIEVLGDPLAMVVAFTTVPVNGVKLNVFCLDDALKKKGYSINALMYPSSLHVCCTWRHTEDGVIDTFLKDLQECMDDLLSQEVRVS